MKLLFENYRSFLNEGARGIQDVIKDNLDIYMKEESDHSKVLFQLVKRMSNIAVAEVEIEHLSNQEQRFGNCLNGYQVIWSEASNDYGPLVYDVAMEYASEYASGLTCDRIVVSDAAYVVWAYYLKNRSDVEVFQLDDLQNTLTPTPKDNCRHQSNDEHEKNGKPPFPYSPLSKLYRKDDLSTIKQLKELGRLKLEVSFDAMDNRGPDWEDHTEGWEDYL